MKSLNVLIEGALYLTDDGACFCGAHCGTTARATGRDLSGTGVVRITPEVRREYALLTGSNPACERCGTEGVELVDHPMLGPVPARSHAGLAYRARQLGFFLAVKAGKLQLTKYSPETKKTTAVTEFLSASDIDTILLEFEPVAA